MSKRRHGQTDGIVVEPTDDEFRRWARHDPESDENIERLLMEQDIDLILTRMERGPLFVELADSDAPERMFFLRCLYLLTWQSLGREEERVRLGYLFHKVSPWTSTPDVVRWMERSKDVVERSRSSGLTNRDLVYEDWACGDLAER